jgi:cell fate regulator YaaT (PSP1 superfamily)
MNIIEIQFAPWDKKYDFDSKGHQLKIGDRVVVKTELGTEIGKVVGFKEKRRPTQEEIKPILRKATLTDLERMEKKKDRAKEAFKFCKKLIKKHGLPMKLIDARFSFDGARLTFAFIAKERVDFRELVKDLTRKFQKSIRLHQVEVRQEARSAGGIGLCGREMCCARFLKNLGQVTTDLIRDQQLTHRGPERLSGPCGRLMCCLAFEECYYKELMKNLPPIGSLIKTPQGVGEVVGWHTLKQSVDVKIDEDTIIEVPIKE